MFLCDSCHEGDCPSGFTEGLMRSRGRCEGCGESAACVDCQGYKRKPLPPEVVAALRDAERRARATDA